MVPRRPQAKEMVVNTITQADAAVRALSADEVDAVSGAGLANPTFRFTLFGYGFEFNSRTVCTITPTEDTCTNIPK